MYEKCHVCIAMEIFCLSQWIFCKLSGMHQLLECILIPGTSVYIAFAGNLMNIDKVLIFQNNTVFSMFL
jgi:hypothetical protein